LSTANNNFTAPVAGNYRVHCKVQYDGTLAAGVYLRVRIRKNSTLYSEGYIYNLGVINDNMAQAHDVVSLVAGDIIDITAGSNDTSFNLPAALNYTSLCIERIK
jgi:hypothetical protein